MKALVVPMCVTELMSAEWNGPQCPNPALLSPAFISVTSVSSVDIRLLGLSVDLLYDDLLSCNV